MGLIIIVAMGLYLLISIGVVAWAISHAKKSGLSVKKWGWGAALVMYMIPFWDWIPTVATHQFYCAKDSGFWVYKTLDQWKAENPGVMVTLVDNSPNEKYPSWPTESWQGKKLTGVNQRFGLLYKDHFSDASEGEIFLNTWRWETKLVDKKTSEVLAKKIDFSTGNAGHIGGMHTMKFWLQNEHCISGKDYSKSFWEFLQQFRGARR